MTVERNMNTQLKDSGIRIIEVRVRNFRSLRSVDVELDRVTVLVGQNNSGKTSLLDAMYAAMGECDRAWVRKTCSLRLAKPRFRESDAY